jgi:hypothetical protein
MVAKVAVSREIALGAFGRAHPLPVKSRRSGVIEATNDAERSTVAACECRSCITLVALPDGARPASIGELTHTRAAAILHRSKHTYIFSTVRRAWRYRTDAVARATGTERALEDSVVTSQTLRAVLDRELDARAHPLPRNGWKLDAVARLTQKLVDRPLE